MSSYGHTNIICRCMRVLQYRLLTVHPLAIRTEITDLFDSLANVLGTVHCNIG